MVNIPKLEIGDVKIYYDVLGEGEPLCLIMGWGGNSDNWHRQRKILSKSHKLILIDNRGVGRSSKPNIPYTMNMFVGDTKAVLDHLNIIKLHLLGASMGGMISQHFALTYPEMLQSLILCCTTADIKNTYGVEGEKLFAFTEITTPEALKDVFGLIFTKKYIDWLYSKEGKVEFGKIIRSMASYPPTAKGMKNQLSALDDHSILDRLPELKIPTLVLVGKDDILLPPKNSELIHEKLPNSELKIINGGHMFWIESEKEFSETVLEFLNRNKFG